MVFILYLFLFHRLIFLIHLYLDDIFGNLSDDEIFKPSNNKSKKKINNSKQKDELFDDFEDPLK